VAKGLAFGLLLSFAATMSSPLEDARAQKITPKIGSYEIPRYGDDVKIVNLYAATDRHLIFEFWYRDRGELKVDYYDTEKKERLFPNQERQIATDNALDRKLRESLGLTRLDPSLFELKLPDGSTVKSANVSGRICARPYAEVFTVELLGARPVERMIAVKPDRPETRSYNRGCTGHDSEKLTTKYVVPALDFFSDGGTGFFVAPSPSRFLIHFDSEGNSDFFDGRGDVVIAPAKDILKFDEGTEGGSSYPDQMRIDNSDAMFDSLASRQLKLKP
jgi:hypothetical protein